jgi:hypothetical protein
MPADRHERARDDANSDDCAEGDDDAHDGLLVLTLAMVNGVREDSFPRR